MTPPVPMTTQQLLPSEFNQQPLFDYQLRDGRRLRFRHAEPDDALAVTAAVATCSPATLLHRFFAPIGCVALPRLRQLLDIDRPASQCLIGELDRGPNHRIVCGLRLVRESHHQRVAEFALTVHDDFQNQAIGQFLMNQLGEMAKVLEIERLQGFLLPSNLPMKRLIQRCAPEAAWKYHTGYLEVNLLPTDLQQANANAPARQGPTSSEGKRSDPNGTNVDNSGK